MCSFGLSGRGQRMSGHTANLPLAARTERWESLERINGASASFGSTPAILRRGWPPPRLAVSSEEIARRSSTVSSRNLLVLALGLFRVGMADERMKSPKFGSCWRRPRLTGMKPSASAICTQPRNAAERLSAGDCWAALIRQIKQQCLKRHFSISAMRGHVWLWTTMRELLTTANCYQIVANEKKTTRYVCVSSPSAAINDHHCPGHMLHNM